MPADQPRQKPPAAPGKVRIIGGSWRGRTLPVPDVEGLRPTPDRVRETVFNWLMHSIRGARCLDLFAGSGAFGFEAASRGAAEVWMVERNTTAVPLLRQSVDRLGATQVRVLADDVMAMVRRPAPAPFDLVFVDPPYALDLVGPAVDALVDGGWLASGALLYTEWPSGGVAPLARAPHKISRAGNIQFALYRFDGESR